MKKLVAFLILVSLLHGQDVFQGRPRQGSVTSIQSFPAPTHRWDFSDGSGSTITAQAGGVNLSCTNLSWGASPTSGDFNGTTTECTAASDILVNLTNWTVSFCLQADSLGEANTGYVITKASGTATHDWLIHIGGGTGSERGRANVYNTSEQFDRWQTNDDVVVVTGGTWQHFAVVFSNYSNLSGSAQWYLNGSAITSTNDNNSTGTRRDSTGFTLRVGNHVGATNRTLDGRLRLMKVWATQALSAGDVANVAAADPCGT